jgi:hypothetical protein
MSDCKQLRNLTPPIREGAPQWKVVGLRLAHRCAFCGSPSEATLGCPDETAPLIFQVGVCNSCLADCVMRRFREVKHQRIAQLAGDMTAAANEIAEARRRFKSERWDREFENLRRRREPDPAVEAEATRRLADEEESVAHKFDMCPGFSYDEFEADLARIRRERRR